jgi:hypothetical protein
MKCRARYKISQERILSVLRGLDYDEVVDNVLSRLADRGIIPVPLETGPIPFPFRFVQEISVLIEMCIMAQLDFLPSYDAAAVKRLADRIYGWEASFKYVLPIVIVGTLARLNGFDRLTASKLMRETLAEMLGKN